MKPKRKLHFSLECVCRLNMATAASAHTTLKITLDSSSSLTLELLCMEMDLNIFSPFISICGRVCVVFVFLKTHTNRICVRVWRKAIAFKATSSGGTVDFWVSQFGKWYCDSCSCSPLAAVFCLGWRQKTEDNPSAWHRFDIVHINKSRVRHTDYTMLQLFVWRREENRVANFMLTEATLGYILKLACAVCVAAVTWTPFNWFFFFYSNNKECVSNWHWNLILMANECSRRSNRN